MSADWYASKHGWVLRRANLMVEGNLDVKYFSIVNDLYEKKHGKSLIGRDLSVFSAGTGDAGGTFGMLEEFPVLYKMMLYDVDSNGKKKYTLAALLDSDAAGKKAAATLLHTNRSLRHWDQIFLLQRALPRTNRLASLVAKYVKQENEKYNDLPCEIEDLLHHSFVDLFLDQHPQYQFKKLLCNDGIHINWSDDAKHALVRFAESCASYSDVEGVIETLISIRFYLGLPPDGI